MCTPPGLLNLLCWVSVDVPGPCPTKQCKQVVRGERSRRSNENLLCHQVCSISGNQSPPHKQNCDSHMKPTPNQLLTLDALVLSATNSGDRYQMGRAPSEARPEEPRCPTAWGRPRGRSSGTSETWRLHGPTGANIEPNATHPSTPHKPKQRPNELRISP